MVLITVVSLLVLGAALVVCSPVRLRTFVSTGYGRDRVTGELLLLWGLFGFRVQYEQGQTDFSIKAGPWSVKLPKGGKRKPPKPKPKEPKPTKTKKPSRWSVSWLRIARDYHRSLLGALIRFYRGLRPSAFSLDTRLGLTDPAALGYLCGLRDALVGLGIPPGLWSLSPDFTASETRAEVTLRLHFAVARILWAGFSFMAWAACRAVAIVVYGRKRGYFHRSVGRKEFALQSSGS